MKKLIFSLCAVVVLALGACDKYDDGPLTNRVDNLEQRVSALETLCKQMNTNIASLQTLVDALQQNDAITSVTPVYEGSEVVGYTISFVKNPSITIYSSDSGNAPVMGIKQDGDGHYYWTLNNGWLMDSDGNKVSAEWVTGNNGILPQFKIENENWYLSLDNGQTWVPLSNMEGSNGNAMFRDIDTSNPDFVVFILADGTELKVAKVSELSIVFEEDAMIAMAPNSTRNIGYTILGDASSLCVEVLSSGKVKARINDSSSSKGILTITTGSTIDEYDKVILLASNGHTTVMSSISFVRHVLTVTSGTIYEVSNAGGVIDINVETNTEYTISIPDAFQNWVSVSGSRAMRQETISLTIAVNEGEPRTATLNLVDKDGYSLANIRINQGYELDNISIPEDMAVAFPDEEFRNYVVENFDINKDGKITSEEALNVEVINTYKSKVEVRSFKGIEYFINLKDFNCQSSSGGLETLDLNQNRKLEVLNCSHNIYLKNLYISNCVKLHTLDCSNCYMIDILDLTGLDNLKKINCTNFNLTTLLVNSTSLEELDCSGCKISELDLRDCVNLKKLSCSENKLKSLSLSNNENLASLYCGDNLLDALDITNNPNLRILSCYNNNISSLDLSKSSNLNSLSCNQNNLTTLDITKTNLGKQNDNQFVGPLSCNCTSMKTIYIPRDWYIRYITYDRSSNYINPATEIIYVE